MKIAIDVSQIVYGTGVSVYTKKLVKNLLAIDNKNEYILFGGSLRRRDELRQFFHTLRVIDSESLKTCGGLPFKGKAFPIPPSLADLIWNRLHVLPIEKLIGKVDVFHSSDWAQPPSKAFKVTTIHDLAVLKYPEYSHPKIISIHRRRLEWVKKEIDKVIVPSAATKKDLVESGIAKRKIIVIPEAGKFSPAKKSLIKKTRIKYQIKGDYLLSVGINPRKNTKRIIKAHERILANQNIKLVLVGQPSFIDIDENENLKIVGYVSDKELSALYTGAKALVYTSLYEGFGIPILEAFNCKTPVVTSNISSMPEVAGDAAVLVDPYKVGSIENGIKKVLKNREKYIKRGLIQVKKFSWQKTAQQTLKVYQEAVN